MGRTRLSGWSPTTATGPTGSAAASSTSRAARARSRRRSARRAPPFAPPRPVRVSQSPSLTATENCRGSSSPGPVGRASSKSGRAGASRCDCREGMRRRIRSLPDKSARYRWVRRGIPGAARSTGGRRRDSSAPIAWCSATDMNGSTYVSSSWDSKSEAHPISRVRFPTEHAISFCRDARRRYSSLRRDGVANRSRPSACRRTAA